jgi:ketosteroid isomerase-like protein
MATTTPTFDVQALRRGIEERDADALIGLYADRAELSTVDRDNPPSRPRVLHGREEIAAQLRDVCARDMTHALERVVVDGDNAAFVESCRYADGTRVLCVATLDLEDGLIVRQSGVQAWDDA